MITYSGVNTLPWQQDRMDKTIRFWRDLLGMRLVAGLGRPGYGPLPSDLERDDRFFDMAGVLRSRRRNTAGR